MFTELHLKYCEYFSQIYDCRSVLGEKQYKVMQEHLMAQYKIDARRLISEKALADAQELFELKYNKKFYTPRGGWWFFGGNDYGKILKKQYKKEFKKAMKELKSGKKPTPAPAATPPSAASAPELPAASSSPPPALPEA